MKSTDELIEKLTSNHNKIDRDFSPITRTFFTIYTILFLVFTILFFHNPYIFKFQNFFHVLEILSLICLIHALTFLGFKSFIPGENKKNALLLTSMSLLFVILAFSSRMIIPQTYHQIRNLCEVEAIAISIATTLFGHFLLKKNEFARNNTLSSMLILALPILATLFMHGVCSIDLIHVMVCHLITPLIIPIFYIFIFMKRVTP